MGIPGLDTDAILTVKAKKDFLVLGMTGHEHLGRMFEYTLELAGTLNMLNMPEDIDIHELMGTQATLKMKAGQDERFFDGYVTRMKRGEKRGRYQAYTMTLQPWLWFATRTKNSKIFQDESVKDIISDVLETYGTDTDWRLDDESVYTSLDYCVQYAETDFDFVTRLMEEVGIYYFFEHEDKKHTMVFIDSMAKHKSRGDTSALKWANAMQSDATVTEWHVQEEARSVKAVLSEYDYLAPTAEIKGEKEADPPPPAGGGLLGAAMGALMGGGGGPSWTKLGDAEWYEHPALVVQNSANPTANETSADAAKQRAQVRVEELLSLYSSATGKTNARDLGTGMTFKLEGTPVSSDEQDYLVAAAFYTLDFADYEAIDDLKESRRREGYRCEFLAMSTSSSSYRMPRTTHKPVVAGLQTAIVVGSGDNEIETDKHGRIKVQFHWDREGENDENSSCWIRVAQPWAGKGYGMFSLPRVGHEVVVQFVDGDPDRPLVTGSVYNSDNMVAWLLPDRSTFSGIRTQSSEGGTAPDNANELRFEDKKDSEYIWLNAEKDFYRIVENDAFDYIGNNETVKVELTRKEVIGENWFMDITKDVMHNMGSDLHVNVAGDIFYTGGATFQLKLEKDFNSKVGGDVGLDVGGKTQLKSKDDIALHSTDGKISLKSGNTPTTGSDILLQGVNVNIKAGSNIVLEAMTGITLKVGGSLINIGSGGIDIVGVPFVKVNSGGGGGSASAALAASPVAPAEAKKEDSTTPEKKDDYDKNFDDPTADDATPS